MTDGARLGRWGRHPYFYVAFTNALFALCLVGVVAGNLAGRFIAGFLGLLLAVPAVYSWHWLLIVQGVGGTHPPCCTEQICPAGHWVESGV